MLRGHWSAMCGHEQQGACWDGSSVMRYVVRYVVCGGTWWHSIRYGMARHCRLWGPEWRMRAFLLKCMASAPWLEGDNLLPGCTASAGTPGLPFRASPPSWPHLRAPRRPQLQWLAWPCTGSSLAAAGTKAGLQAGCCAATTAACRCATPSTLWSRRLFAPREFDCALLAQLPSPAARFSLLCHPSPPLAAAGAPPVWRVLTTSGTTARCRCCRQTRAPWWGLEARSRVGAAQLALSSRAQLPCSAALLSCPAPFRVSCDLRLAPCALPARHAALPLLNLSCSACRACPPCPGSPPSPAATLQCTQP